MPPLNEHPTPHKPRLKNSDTVGLQPGTDHFDQGFDSNLETQQPFEPNISEGLGGGAHACPEVESSGQAVIFWQLDTGGIDQPMESDQDTPVPTPQASLPLTAASVEPNGTTK